MPKALLYRSVVPALVAATFFFLGCADSRGERTVDPAKVDSVYSSVRAKILTGSRAQLGLDSTSASAWGVLMETSYEEGTATVVSLADGSASIYFSGGGGVIGGIDHEKVRKAATAFVSAAGRNLQRMKPAKNFPLPRVGHTVFYVLTDNGVLMVDGVEENLGEGNDALSPLFYAGQEVITELQAMDEKARGQN